ncbi:MAG: FecR domain-containing protein [Gammaproteobacteria bacterium]|nr:FecR domain-containing protein [Gammaproteobacteria bacterium]
MTQAKMQLLPTRVKHNAVLHGALKLLLVALFSLLSSAAYASAGVVTHLSGTLVATLADGSSKILAVKSEVAAGETLTTQAKTYARIKFSDGGEVVLRPNSQFAVKAYSYDEAQPQTDNVAVGLLKGGMRMVTGLVGKRNADQVKVETATATVGIRGTHFGLLLCQEVAGGGSDCKDIPTVAGDTPDSGLHIDVAVGAVILTNRGGEQLLSAGEFGYVRDLLTPPVIVPPNQGIRVTMPQNISKNNAIGRSVGQSQSNEAECSIP